MRSAKSGSSITAPAEPKRPGTRAAVAARVATCSTAGAIPLPTRPALARIKRLFAQHCAHWVPKGLPGAGHLLVFNNGMRRPDGSYSSVDEIVPPVDEQGRYTLKPGAAYGPEKAIWTYTAPKKSDLFSMCHLRRPAVAQWRYPYLLGHQWRSNRGDSAKGGCLEIRQPGKRRPGAGRPGRIWRSTAIRRGPGPDCPDRLKLSAEQKAQLDVYQEEVTGQLDKILTEEQQKQLQEGRTGLWPRGLGAPPRPGQITVAVQPDPLEVERTSRSNRLKNCKKKLTPASTRSWTTIKRNSSRKCARRLRYAPGGGPPGFALPAFARPSGRIALPSPSLCRELPRPGRPDLAPGKTIEELEKTAK